MAVTETDQVMPRGRIAVVRDNSTNPLILFLFIASLMMPIVLSIGPFNVSPSRLFAILLFFPSVGLWLAGHAGKKRTLDFLLIFAACWASIAIFYHHGFGFYERAGFIFVEMVGGYFFGRTFVRSAKDFMAYMGFVVGALMFMLPFGVLESLTGDPIIIETLSGFVRTEPVIDHQVRLGLERAQVVFPHPILYGVFCAAMLGVMVRAVNYQSSGFTSVFRIGLVMINTICSVSSGAWLMFIVQSGFLMYDRIMRTIKLRWRLMLIGVVSMYLLVEVAANSSPFRVFVRYFTLNANSGHYRIAQFDAVMVNILRDPLLGIGFKPWTRPRWMIPSIDNYWLVITVRYGMPYFFSFLGGVLFTMYHLGRLKFADPKVSEIRAGYLISLGGFLLAAVTVHIWSNMNVWFMFFLGAGMWMFDAELADKAGDQPATRRVRGRTTGGDEAEETGGGATEMAETRPREAYSRYSRFPVKAKADAPDPSGPRRRR